MVYDLYPEVGNEAVSRASQSLGVGEPSAFAGFARGVGTYTMRGFAETARAIDLAGAVGPIVLDRLTGGTERQDQYFKEHDEVFNRAVDHWTPKPGEVGAAGQIVGSLAGALPLVIANPALAVASTTLSSAEDLTRQGVGPYAATGVGMIQGATLATGLRLPYIGKTLASRVISGAAGNVGAGIAGTAGSKAALLATGNDQAAEQFNPFDPTQRTLDLLMGAAFGGLAHLDAKGQQARTEVFDQQTKNAILTLNQARHLEDVALPGKEAVPGDLNKGVLAVRTAMDQMLRGDPVNVEQITQGMGVAPDPARVKARAEAADVAAKLAKEVLPDAQAPIERPPLIEPAKAGQEPVKTTPPAGDAGAGEAQRPLAEGASQPNQPGAAGPAADPIVETARTIAAERPELRVPTGELDAQGNAISMTAADYMAKAAETTRLTQADAGLFRTAITCLLGML